MDIFERLATSKFRSSFKLKEKDINYIKNKGLPLIESHARDFIDKRLAPSFIPNDGKQTPFRGHPVFVAQHATATCCRSCLYKWHNIKMHNELTSSEKEYIVTIIMNWIKKEIKNN